MSLDNNPIGQAFSLRPSLVHLNHAAVGPWPQRTIDRVQAFAAENANQAAMDYPGWLREISDLRTRLGALLDVSSQDIALTKNTSDGISMIAAGLPARPGDNVVVPASEFPSNRYAWEALQQRGIEVRQPGRHGRCPSEDEIIDAMDNRTVLLSISAVQYDTGWRYDLATLGQACRERSAQFCVDAIQQAGALPFSAQSIGADFVIGGSHKWLMAPEGLGYFYAHPNARDSLALSQYGWCMVDRPFAFETGEQWQPSDSARRFEPGTLNTLGALALNQSLAFLLEDIGIQTVSDTIAAAVDYLEEAIRRLPGFEIISDLSRMRRSGILAVRHARLDENRIYRELMKNDVYCAARGGYLRFSPHCHLDASRLQRAIDVLEAISTSRP